MVFHTTKAESKLATLDKNLSFWVDFKAWMAFVLALIYLPLNNMNL